MKHKTLLKVVFIPFIVLAVAVGVTSINHPIILRWITGTAMHHGQPMAATVYVNGKVSDYVNVYYTDEENSYLATIHEDDKSSEVRFIHIDVNRKFVGVPVATSKKDYDLVAGHLFQSKTSTDFLPLVDSAKGEEFEVELTFANDQIRFTLLSRNTGSDSVRIILP